MSEKMPVLFIGHGSPLNIVLDNDFTRSLAAWGKRLPRPEAIMVISAHWLTSGTSVTCCDMPGTIHDFFGFPAELYDVTYPAPGAPALAEVAAGLVSGTTVSCNRDRGLDHGAWSVLHHLFPKAEIPVFQLSLDYTFNDWQPKPLQYHYDLARELAALRRQGVLIIGSGNIVHNLSLIDWDIAAVPFAWAVELDERVKAAILAGNHGELLHYRAMGVAAEMGISTLDHYLPMIYAIALREEGEPLVFIHEGIQNGSISMRSFQIG